MSGFLSKVLSSDSRSPRSPRSIRSPRLAPPNQGSISEQASPINPFFRRTLFDDDDAEDDPSGKPPEYPTVELPPTYTPVDENVRIYQLQAPFIYDAASHTPRYQFKLQYTRTGKPQSLCIRRLMHHESRRLSRTSSRGEDDDSLILKRITSHEYDDDGTMYKINRLLSLGSNSWALEIRGQRASTLPGYIKVDRQPGKRCLFYHMTRNPANDMLKAENERRMQKWGYHAEDEWDQRLIFAAVKGGRSAASAQLDECSLRWIYSKNNDRLVAGEAADGALKFTGLIEPRIRDALITCWVAKCWLTGALAWPDQRRKSTS